MIKLIVNKTNGTTYIPDSIREDGFVGEMQAYTSTFGIFIVKTGVSFDAVLECLEAIKGEILRRTKLNLVNN